jgi:hypothetical protein
VHVTDTARNYESETLMLNATKDLTGLVFDLPSNIFIPFVEDETCAAGSTVGGNGWSTAMKRHGLQVAQQVLCGCHQGGSVGATPV